MNATEFLRKELEAIDECLSNFLPPIPRRVVAVANRKIARVLVACPVESRGAMALAICEVFRRHHIADDTAGLVDTSAPQRAAPAAPGAGIVITSDARRDAPITSRPYA